MELREWALPVCALVVLAAVLAFVWLGPNLTPNQGCPGCPIPGSPVAVGPPTEAPKGGSAGQLELYDFPIQAASSGLTWSDLAFQLETAAGNIVGTSASGWNLTAWDAAGTEVGIYSIQASSPTWTTGGSGGVASGEAIILQAPVSTPPSGDNLVVTLAGPFDGTISVPIP